MQTGSPPQTRNGRITWNVEVVPSTVVSTKLPATSSDALWNYAREVDAATVALAFVDRFVPTIARYVERKAEMCAALRQRLFVLAPWARCVDLVLNALDEPSSDAPPP